MWISEERTYTQDFLIDIFIYLSVNFFLAKSARNVDSKGQLGLRSAEKHFSITEKTNHETSTESVENTSGTSQNIEAI